MNGEEKSKYILNRDEYQELGSFRVRNEGVVTGLTRYKGMRVVIFLVKDETQNNKTEETEP